MTREFASADERHQDQIAHETFTAYQTVRCWALTRSKKRMPSFAELMPKAGASKQVRQTGEQMASVLQVLAASSGGKLVKVKRVSR